MEELLTSDEAAALLRVDPRTLENWRTARRYLRFTKVGAAVRYRRGDVERFIQERTVEAVSAE